MKSLSLYELFDRYIGDLTEEELQELIDNEEFNSVEPFPIFKVSKCSFETDDGLEITTEFLETINSTEDYNFIYKANENEFQEKIVPYSIYSRILATLSDIIRDFIKNKNPKSIFLKSNPRIEGTEDRAKHNIHGHCLKMQIYKIPEYDYKELEDGWLIYRK